MILHAFIQRICKSDGVIVAKNITGEDLHKKLKEVIK